jgi:hypothetical protein
VRFESKDITLLLCLKLGLGSWTLVACAPFGIPLAHLISVWTHHSSHSYHLISLTSESEHSGPWWLSPASPAGPSWHEVGGDKRPRFQFAFMHWSSLVCSSVSSLKTNNRCRTQTSHHCAKSDPYHIFPIPFYLYQIFFSELAGWYSTPDAQGRSDSVLVGWSGWGSPESMTVFELYCNESDSQDLTCLTNK